MLFEKNKKGETNLMQVGVFFLFAALVGQQFGLFSIGGTAAGSPPMQNLNVKVEGACSVDQTSLKLVNYNKYITSTALTDGNSFWRLFRNSQNEGLSGDGTIVTVSPGDTVKIYAGENSSTRYTQLITQLKVDGVVVDKVPCSGAVLVEAMLAPMGGAPTLTYTNANGQVNTAQDLGADVDRVFKIKLDAPNNAATGNPYFKAACVSGNAAACNRICHQFNTTVVDKTEVSAVKINGEAVSGFTSVGVSTPRAISNNNSGTNMGASGTTFSCWTLPQLEDNQQLEYSLLIDTAATAPATIHSINVSLATADYDLHASTLAEIVGVEDEDFNALGGGPFFLANPIDVD